MKNKQTRVTYTLYVLMVLGIIIITPVLNSARIFEVNSISVNFQFQKCQGINSKGKPCGNNAKRNSRYCDFHDPNRIKCKAIASSTKMQCKNSPSSTCAGYCSVHCDQKVDQ